MYSGVRVDSPADEPWRDLTHPRRKPLLELAFDKGFHLWSRRDSNPRYRLERACQGPLGALAGGGKSVWLGSMRLVASGAGGARATALRGRLWLIRGV